MIASNSSAVGVEPVEHRVGAQLRQAASALGAGGHSAHVRAAELCELHGEASHAAAGTRHEHAQPEHLADYVQRAQSGEAGDGQRRGLLVGDARGQLGQRLSCPLRPSPPTRRAARRPRHVRPSHGPLPSGAWAATVPARSHPVSSPAAMSASRRTSPRLSEKALTRTSAWPGSGRGSGASPSARFPGSPGAASSARIKRCRRAPRG